jgi:hypothetical protein
MSEHHVNTGEVNEAEKIVDVVFPPNDKSSEVVHPGEEPFHLPSSAIATQLSPVLGEAFASAPVGRDQLDAVVFCELGVERVRVVGFVADEPGRELVEKTSGKNLFHKPALGR